MSLLCIDKVLPYLILTSLPLHCLSFFFSLHDRGFWKQSLSHVLCICESVSLEAIPFPIGNVTGNVQQEVLWAKKGFPLLFEAYDVCEGTRKRVNQTAGLWKQRPKTTTTVTRLQMNSFFQARLINSWIFGQTATLHLHCVIVLSDSFIIIQKAG